MTACLILLLRSNFIYIYISINLDQPRRLIDEFDEFKISFFEFSASKFVN